MRSIASGYLQKMLDEDKIEEVKYEWLFQIFTRAV
jgi:hypothetical protein